MGCVTTRHRTSATVAATACYCSWVCTVVCHSPMQKSTRSTAWLISMLSLDIGLPSSELLNWLANPCLWRRHSCSLQHTAKGRSHQSELQYPRAPIQRIKAWRNSGDKE